jgi:capsule biosynthesis phosphatase
MSSPDPRGQIKPHPKPRIVIDLDDTLTDDGSHSDYAAKLPRADVIAKLRDYSALGYEVVIFSARNMRTHQGQIGRINLHTLPGVLAWLTQHNVPHDEVIMGKPWCGPGGFYVDDKAIRPDEFVRLSREQIAALIGDSEPGEVLAEA